MKNNIIYVRNCPKCNKELKTKNKYWHTASEKNNKLCQSCSLTGRIFSEEWKQKLKENHANVSGNLNPFKGKSHSKESIDKMLLSRSKNPTWKENASNAMKRVRQKYWNDTNPMDNADSVSKIRLFRIDEIKNKNNGQISPNYNKSSIPIIEAKAKELGITDLQHAENGGEFYIKELGYWVDGYSKEKNVVIEYYEKHHKRQIKKDKTRESAIKNFLKCEFIIINELDEN